MRVLAWPRSPRKITSWPARSAFSSCGQDRVLVAEDPGNERLARGDARDRVAAHLFLDRDGLPARLAKLTEGGGARDMRASSYRREPALYAGAR